MAGGKYSKDPGTGGTTGNTDPSSTSGGSTSSGTSSTDGGTSGQPPVAERFLVHIPVNSPSASSTTADRKVDDLFRQVFRGKVPDKPAELIDKLNQVVRAKKVEGRGAPEFEFSTKSLTGTTKSINGQSVAQTSLFERAHAALSDAEKRLDELKPMQAPTDPENLDALRTVTAATYKRLVNELGEGGGPRNKRALRLFHVLIGKQEGNTVELKNGSLLKQIESEFKLTGSASNPEHSASQANFRIIKENLFDVFRSWGTFKGEIEGDFGARAAKLSRTFVLIQDDVTDLEAVLDAVGYDATDRETDPLPGLTESEKITVDGLLTWIREFAAEEGPQMLKDGGATGVIATIPVFEELITLSGQLETMLKAMFSESKSVEASVKSLNNRLIEAKDIVDKIEQAAS